MLNPKDDDRRDNRTRGPIKFAYASGSKPLEGYTIKRGVGVGGFGDVYFATSDAGKEVALKRIQRNLDVELRGVKQCLNLKHHNLVALYDIRYDDEGQAWVVMEYVTGESLQDVIERNPNGMPKDQVEKWFAGIADGVGYLHDHGIVHRDLKPGNIFVDHNMIKIGDYGLAKFISCSRRSGQTESVGTFHYMAPEIGLGRYGKEIDIYALGILLYEMLTGRVPYEGESSQEIIMKHLTATPNLQAVAEPYRSVIGKALAKDPEMRFRTIDEMTDALALASSSTNQTHDHATYNEEEPILAEVIQPGRPPEPVARAVRELGQDVQHKWQNSGLTGPMKVFLLVLLVIFSTITSVPLLNLGILLGVAYCFYYVIWYLITSVSSPSPRQTPAQRFNVKTPNCVMSSGRPITPVPPKKVLKKRLKPISQQQVLESLRESLAEKSSLRKMRELTGSMLMAAVVSGVLCTFAMLPGLKGNETSVYDWGPMYAWMAMTSTLGSWCILTLSKFWERQTGDQALRRFCLLTAGLGVGAISYLLANGLMLNATYIVNDLRVDLLKNQLPALYWSDGTPKNLAYIGYIGGLFVLLRWWAGADPLRSTRLSFMATAVTVLIAVVLHSVLPLPRGFLVAAIMAIAVQLSAPWVDNAARKKVKKQLEAERLIEV